MAQPTYLGLDSSTQSLSAVVVDVDGKIVASHSVVYRDEPGLRHFGLDPVTLTLHPEHPGQADQSAPLYVASLGILLDALKKKGAPLESVVRIGVSAQQHGCVFLNSQAALKLERLAAADGSVPIETHLEGIFSHPRAPIWMTSDTEAEAKALAQAAGGVQAMVQLTGSGSPLRFTGALIRKFGLSNPRAYEATAKIAMISQFFPMMLTGTSSVPADWGDGSGTSLMDYRAHVWSPLLVEACARGLPGGAGGLSARIGLLSSPQTVAGRISSWFVARYGFSPNCEVMIGSGDNPQTKVLVEDDLLSLGTSFVMMAVPKTGLLDPRGWGNAMIDGTGRPFVFGCRTNGALVWDRARLEAGADFARAEAALAQYPPGSVLALEQPEHESFPPSPALSPARTEVPFERRWAGVVDSSLGLLVLGSQIWLKGKTTPLALTGGPAASPGIVRRVAAITGRTVRVIGTTGAALGAAASAAAFGGKRPDWMPSSQEVVPLPQDLEAVHKPGGYLDQLKQLFETTTGIDPTGEKI